MAAGRRWMCGALALAALWALAPAALAAQVRVQVVSADGAVSDAVVSLHGGEPASARGAIARMEQRGSAFVPAVLPIQAGTLVDFPNRDRIQHHVYSFSRARPFEIPLYSGDSAPPIRFDTPGVVVVGCNIHDWMIGRIVVLDTPYFALSSPAGDARLEVPAGTYRLRVWHARGTGEPVERELVVPAAGASVSVRIVLAPVRAGARGSSRLRTLQDRFRRLKGGP